MEYYHNLVTQQSWELLTHLHKEVSFVLIGGWATYLYTKTLKSKDIDIIIDYDQLAVLKKHYAITKNDRLHKYEARRDLVQIDIYLPHYSHLGIPVEELQKEVERIKGFVLLERHYLFALKLFTLSQRGHSPKGVKDFIDTLALVQTAGFSLPTAAKILTKYQLHDSVSYFKDYLNHYTQLPELSLSTHRFAAVKKKLKANF